MPGINGLDLLKSIRQIKPDLDVVIVTNSKQIDIEFVEECLKVGAVD